MKQVGLFRLRWQAGTGAAALHIDDDERQFRHHREVDGFALQADARPTGARHTDGPAEAGTDGHPTRGDLIFGLQRLHAVPLHVGQLFEYRTRRGDRVATVDERLVRRVCCGNQTQGNRFVSGDLAIRAGRDLCRGHLVLHRHHFHGVAVVVAGLQGFGVGIQHRHGFRFLAELFLDPLERLLHRPLEHPVHETEGEEVLAAILFAGRQAAVPHGFLGHLRHWDPHHPVLGQATVIERVHLVFGFVQVVRFKCIAINNENAAILEVFQVCLECCGVHDHKCIKYVAGGMDFMTAEVNLEAGNPGQCACGCADFGGEVRKGGDVVPEDGRRVGELCARQLHAVAGVACKTDRHRLHFQSWLRPASCGLRFGGGCSVGWETHRIVLKAGRDRIAKVWAAP